jgi:hypothetical protein
VSATRTRGGGAGESVPIAPQTAPQAAFSQPGHDFTLQAVMELHKSVGEMNATMRGMKNSIDSVKGKVDDLVGWKHMIIGGAAALGAVIALLGFVVGKASDYVAIKVPALPQAASAQVLPQAAPAATVGTPKP